MKRLGAILPYPLVCTLEVRSPPMQEGYLSDTCAIPYANKAKRVRYPTEIRFQKVIARYGGVSRNGLLRWGSRGEAVGGPCVSSTPHLAFGAKASSGRWRQWRDRLAPPLTRLSVIFTSRGLLFRKIQVTDVSCLVSQCSATVRHCSCYTRCSATPFYDIDMANLRRYPPPPKRTEAAATVLFLRPFQGCSATVVRHCENTRPKMLHKCSATAVARHPWCSV